MGPVEFVAELWRTKGEAGWYFVTLPHDVADDIDEVTAPTRTGFGSVRVEVSIGTTTWRTSVFPDSTAACYVLPIKRAVRAAESLAEGDRVTATLRLI